MTMFISYEHCGCFSRHVSSEGHPMTFLCRDETEVCFQTIHNLALGRDEWLALHFGRFTLKKQPVPIVQEAE